MNAVQMAIDQKAANPEVFNCLCQHFTSSSTADPVYFCAPAYVQHETSNVGFFFSLISGCKSMCDTTPCSLLIGLTCIEIFCQGQTVVIQAQNSKMCKHTGTHVQYADLSSNHANPSSDTCMGRCPLCPLCVRQKGFKALAAHVAEVVEI